MSDTIAVLLGGGCKILRETLRSVLMSQSGLRIVGDAPDGPSAVRLAKQLKPRVTVLISALPKAGVLTTTRAILSGTRGRGKVVICSAYPFRISSTAAREAGATGYVTEDSTVEDLVAAIYAAAADRLCIVDDGQGVDHLSAHREASVEQPLYREHGRAELTHRELQVLELLSDGLRTSEIAKKLFISEKTVESHRSHIMDKLGIHTIAGLTKYAVQGGLAALDS